MTFGVPVAKVEWQAVGFPWAQERPGATAPRTAAESANGWLDPLTGLRGGTYDLEISGSIPDARGIGMSPWGGMSGAAVFAEGSLVAVIAEDPANFGPDRLRAIPISLILDDLGAGAVLKALNPRTERVWPGHKRAFTHPYAPLPVPPTPLLLLQSRYAATPFHESRRAQLQSLCDWCRDPTETVAVAVIDGVGGTGKTRLASELCEVMQAEDWVAGFLNSAVDESSLTSLSQLAVRRLVIVDSAEARTTELLSFAHILASQPQSASMRLLILARNVGPGGSGTNSTSWWRSLQTARNPLQAAFLVSTRQSLEPLEQGSDGLAIRRSIFISARDRFADLLGLPPSAVEPDLEDAMYDSFLFLQIGALVALTPRERMPTTEEELLTAVLDAERDLIWRPTAQESRLGVGAGGLTDSELDTAICIATLGIAFSRASAIALLQHVPEISTAGPVSRVADWLHSLYPGPGWLRPIRPDRLGEHLVAHTITELQPELPRILVGYSADSMEAGDKSSVVEASHSIGRLLTVLVRAHQSESGDQLRASLQAALVEAPNTATPPLLKMVESAVRYQSEPDVIAPMANGLSSVLGVVQIGNLSIRLRKSLKNGDSQSYALDDLKDQIALQVLEFSREEALRDQRKNSGLLPALFDARVALMHSGRVEESTATALEALELARRLYAEDPKSNAQNLIQALEIAGVSGFPSGEEIRYSEEAIGLLEQQALADPRLLPRLAASYQGLAFKLSALARQTRAGN